MNLLEIAALAMDEDNKKPMTDLEKHDAKYHGGHYDGKSKCKYRDNLAKGDEADNLDPENVDGENVQEETSTNNTLVAPTFNKNNLQQLFNDLDDYEKKYNDLTSGAGVATLKKLLTDAQTKNPNSIVAQILQKKIADAQAKNASTLPQGTLSPQELRNKMALEIAKAIGANLEVPATTQQPQPSISSKQQVPLTANQTQVAAPAQPLKLGPNASLSIDDSSFPMEAEFDFHNYGSSSDGWKSAGSGSTNPHKKTINGVTYFVKRAGSNPTYSKDAAQNEVNANKFIRLAGFNAPESKFYHTKNGDFCVTKEADTTDYANNNLKNKKVKNQLVSAYPLMALMYNTDILINDDNAFIDKNGDLVFLDNGSTFGFGAQGKRPNPNLNFDFDKRDDATATGEEGIAGLATHPNQTSWKTVLNGWTKNDYFKAASNYDMGALVKEGIKLGLVPKPAEKALQAYADSIDRESAQYKKTKTQTSGSQSQQTQSNGTTSQSQNTQPTQAAQSSPGATTVGANGVTYSTINKLSPNHPIHSLPFSGNMFNNLARQTMISAPNKKGQITIVPDLGPSAGWTSPRGTVKAMAGGFPGYTLNATKNKGGSGWHIVATPNNNVSASGNSSFSAQNFLNSRAQGSSGMSNAYKTIANWLFIKGVN